MRKLRESWNRKRFLSAIAPVHSTPPLARGNAPLIALSMVQKRDVLPYLLSIKSFSWFLNPQRVVLIADPTLDAEDRSILRLHIPHIEIRPATDFRFSGVPVGGCWERLCAISDYVGEGYVIQLDADTVTVGALHEVANAVRNANAFALGTTDVFPHVLPATEIARWAQGSLRGNDHVQMIGESLLDRLDSALVPNYVRGCAGFSGFPMGSFDREKLVLISQSCERIMGARWHEWGTEQFTSNIIVANSAGGDLLPHPRYCAPHRKIPETVFLHFIGYVRFATGLYAKMAHDFVHQKEPWRRGPES